MEMNDILDRLTSEVCAERAHFLQSNVWKLRKTRLSVITCATVYSEKHILSGIVFSYPFFFSWSILGMNCVMVHPGVEACYLVFGVVQSHFRARIQEESQNLSDLI